MIRTQERFMNRKDKLRKLIRRECGRLTEAGSPDRESQVIEDLRTAVFDLDPIVSRLRVVISSDHREIADTQSEFKNITTGLVELKRAMNRYGKY